MSPAPVRRMPLHAKAPRANSTCGLALASLARLIQDCISVQEDYTAAFLQNKNGKATGIRCNAGSFLLPI